MLIVNRGRRPLLDAPRASAPLQPLEGDVGATVAMVNRLLEE